MVRVILAHNHFDMQHLIAVMQEMQKIGAPTVRGYWAGDYFQAIEGCHRLRAAAALGITPDLEGLDEDTLRSDVDDLDYDDGQDPDEATIGSIGDLDNNKLIFED